MNTVLDEIDSPALLVDLDVVERNLARGHRRLKAKGVAVWPHVKTHKAPWLASLQVRHGADGITVAKLGEAEVMLEAGIRDILIDYPLIGAAKTRRLAQLLERGARIRVALDSLESIATVARAARLTGTTVDVLVEVDTGLHRVGVTTCQEAVTLARDIVNQQGLRFQGVASFAGHIGRAQTEAERQEILQAESRIVETTVEALHSAGLAPTVVSLGGTHHLARLDQLGPCTELRPGTYITNDRTVLTSGSCEPSDCALTVLVTVVSRRPTWAVIDGGSKTFSSDPHPDGGFGLIVGHPQWRFAWCNEEHGVIVWPADDEGPRIGQRLQVIPNHACPVFNLHPRAYGVRSGVATTDIAVAAQSMVQ